jgi:ABC-type uncharacterized transport system ATPase component
MITHEKDIADYAKRIVILSDGKIVSENKIDEKNKYDLNRPARIN